MGNKKQAEKEEGGRKRRGDYALGNGVQL